MKEGNKILEKIKDTLHKEPNLNKDKILINSNFKYDLGIDSSDVVGVVMALEEEFNIDIDDKDAEEFFTIRDIVDYIHQRLEKS